MPFIKKYIENQKVSRRNFLLASAAGLGGAAAAGVFGPGVARAASTGSGRAIYNSPTLAWSYRNRSNPYWNAIASGGEDFAQGIGEDLVQMINQGSSRKSLNDVKALVSMTGGNLALAIDPNDAPNCRPVVETVSGAKGYLSTIWNKTDDIHPWEYGDYWVSHMTWNDVKPAEQTARILLNAIGGKGNIVGLGGIPSNPPAIQRKQGLKNALKDFPNVELLAYQPADWSTQQAYQIMLSFLTRYGNKIDGVFCANDTIGYGVLEALRAAGKYGEIPIVTYDGNSKAVNLVIKGAILATVSTNPYWAGGITASLAYHAATGAFTPSEEPKEHREFYGPTILITHENAKEFKKKHFVETPGYDWTIDWKRTAGPIQYD